MNKDEDIADVRECAAGFRSASENLAKTGEDLHTLIVETIITLRTTDVLSREATIDRLERIDTMARAVVQMGEVICNGVAKLHEVQADKKERGEL